MNAERRPLVALAVGILALVLAVAIGGWRWVAPSYLAAWTCLVGLAAGALPLVALCERVDLVHGIAETALLARLRGFLGLMPLAALLGIPLVFALDALYPWTRGEGPHTALAAVWFTKPFLVARAVVYLAVWIWLSRVFGQPNTTITLERGGGRRALLGFGLYLVVGTLLVGDLLMATAAAFRSSLSGLLVLAAWSGLALAAATMLAPREGPAAAHRDRLVPLVVVTGIWFFLHLVQFLTLWSANLPDDAAWYLARGGAFGWAAVVLGAVAAALPALLLLAPGDGRTRVAAALLVVAHVVEMVWLVTPSARGTFVPRLADVLALVGIVGLGIGLLPYTERFRQRPVATARPA